MRDPVRLALVGCGAISEWHRNALREVPEIEVTAAVDVDGARAAAVAEAYGAAAHTSLSAANDAGGFDAVLLMVPHDLHEDLAVSALAAGRHVMLEKPMAPTVAACERILAAASRSPAVFMVAENAQYWPEVLIAKRLIDEGAIGELVTGAAHLFFPPIPAYYGGARAWRMSATQSGGGVSIDTGSHYIRPLRLWFGEIDEVVAAMERPYARMEGESLARALFRFESGRVASFDLMLTEAPIGRQEMFRISGTRGELLIGAGVRLYDEADRGGRPVDGDVPQGYMHSYVGQLRDFANAVLTGEPLAAGPEQSLGELRVALAMERSSKSRRWEKVWE